IFVSNIFSKEELTMKKILTSKKSKIILFSIIGVILIGIGVLATFKIIDNNKVFTLTELMLETDKTQLTKINEVKITQVDYPSSVYTPVVYLSSLEQKEEFDKLINFMDIIEYKKCNVKWDTTTKEEKESPNYLPDNPFENMFFNASDLDKEIQVMFMLDKSGIVRRISSNEYNKSDPFGTLDVIDAKYYWKPIDKANEEKEKEFIQLLKEYVEKFAPPDLTPPTK
ncbi:MAG: hypothetical protein RSA79_02100, partial [Oscillospiraceae bacterium]